MHSDRVMAASPTTGSCRYFRRKKTSQALAAVLFTFSAVMYGAVYVACATGLAAVADQDESFVRAVLVATVVVVGVLNTFFVVQLGMAASKRIGSACQARPRSIRCRRRGSFCCCCCCSRTGQDVPAAEGGDDTPHPISSPRSPAGAEAGQGSEGDPGDDFWVWDLPLDCSTYARVFNQSLAGTWR